MRTWNIIKCVFYGIMIFFGVLFNFFIIISSIIDKELKKIPFLFSLNLSIINICISLITMPSIILNTSIDIFKKHHNVCVGVGYTTMGLLDASIWSMALGSLHFYIGINHALHYRKYVTKQRVYIALIMVWIFSFLIFTPPLIGWGKISLGDNLCLVDARNDKSYLLFTVVIGYFIPFVITIFTNIQICSYLIKHRKKTFEINGNFDDQITNKNKYSWFSFIKDLLCFRNIQEEDEEGIIF